MMSHFENVIREFQHKRLEKEINSQQVRHERLQELREMAHIADMEMRQRKSRKQRSFNY